MEAGPGDVRALKELLGYLERRPDVPGDEVHIAAEKAGGSAGEGEDLRAVPGAEQFLQLVPEGEDLLRSFFLPQGVQGIAEEARHRAVCMERVHEVVVGIQVAVDERHAVGGADHHIQPPIGIRVLVGFHFVAEVAVQIGFRVSGEIGSALGASSTSKLAMYLMWGISPNTWSVRVVSIHQARPSSSSSMGSSFSQ